MEYKKIFSSKINNEFSLINNDIFFKKENIIFKIDRYFKYENFFTFEPPFTIVGSVDKELCIRNKFALIFIDIHSKEEIRSIPLKFQHPLQIKLLINDNLILREKFDENNWKVLNLNSLGNTRWEKQNNNTFMSIVYQQAFVFLYNELNILELSRIDTGLRIWSVSLRELTQSEITYNFPELIAMNEQLYFQMQSANRKGLFCLDINTGKELALYSDCYGFVVHDDKYVYSCKYPNIVCAINTETNAYTEFDLYNLIKENGFVDISDHRCVAHNGLIYITQSIGDKHAKVGIIDPLHKALLWKHTFEASNGAIGSIQVNDTRLFIQTQDNTLHIFERQTVS